MPQWTADGHLYTQAPFKSPEREYHCDRCFARRKARDEATQVTLYMAPVGNMVVALVRAPGNQAFLVVNGKRVPGSDILPGMQTGDVVSARTANIMPSDTQGQTSPMRSSTE